MYNHVYALVGEIKFIIIIISSSSSSSNALEDIYVDTAFCFHFYMYKVFLPDILDIPVAGFNDFPMRPPRPCRVLHPIPAVRVT